MAFSARAQAITPTRGPRSGLFGVLVVVSGLVGLTGLVGCSATDANELPPGVQDPAIIKTSDGALAFYRGVLARIPGTFDQVVANAGVMTDELTGVPAPSGVSTGYTEIDSRNAGQNAGPSVATYKLLHRLRAQAREARGFLATYVADSDTLAGHLYGIEAYAVVFLADLYCSGVPLSTVDFGADYTLASGSTTEELYRHAVALFDTALTLTGSNTQAQQLAVVGRGRALLALGRYDSAAATVAAVPTNFRYNVVSDTNTIFSLALFAAFNSNPYPIMGDLEGLNGLDYRSSGDPRTPVSVLSTSGVYGNTIYYAAKYPTEGPTTYTIADGLEARLIEAEAALSASPDNGQWLATLNQLRATVGLADTTDPGTADARVNLLFRERAFWLYLTAHRQGDLRRLIRQYHRPTTAVYPTGFFSGGGTTGRYGSEVTLPVPEDEQQFNPNYTGCIDRNA